MQPKRCFVSATIAVLTILTIAACGGGGSHKSSSSTTTTTTTSATATAPAKPKPKPKIAVTVRSNSSGAKYQSSLTANVGEPVEFRTVVPGKGGGTVQLKVTQSGGHITLMATEHHHSASATVTANNKGAVLNGLHYACQAPPTSTFCPAQNLKASGSGYEVQFPLKQHTPIFLEAKLATSAAPPARKLRPSSSAVVSTYVVNLKLKVVAAKTSTAASSKPVTSATVHSGDVVDLETHLGGKVSGAPQPVTITVPQGPSKSLTISASVPGGATSHAVITSASGGTVTLVAPHYTCFFPPYSTFCPAKSVHLANKTYTFTFDATPNTSPVIVVAKVQQA